MSDYVDSKTQKHSDKPSGDRRKTLKTLLVGSGVALAAGKTLPDKWTKPVVDSVILPAHAQTTTPPDTTDTPQEPTTSAAPTTTTTTTTTIPPETTLQPPQ